MLIDTSGFFSIQDRAEKHHHLARQSYADARSRLTTNYILTEYSALALVRGMSQGKIVDFSDEVLVDDSVEIVWVGEDLHRRAVELLRQRQE